MRAEVSQKKKPGAGAKIFLAIILLAFILFFDRRHCKCCVVSEKGPVQTGFYRNCADIENDVYAKRISGEY